MAPKLYVGESSFVRWVLFTVLALAVGGCASLSGVVHHSADQAKQLPERQSAAQIDPEGVKTTDSRTEPASRTVVANLEPQTGTNDSESFRITQKAPSQVEPPVTQTQLEIEIEFEEYDPWEPFNQKTFEFNRGLDRWVIKPVAKGYNEVMPDPWQEAVGNAFSNLGFLPRFVNCTLQGRFTGAGREILRFIVNSTIGLGGFMDIAGREGIKKCSGDTGQTLGVWGVGSGPYLILPFLPPLTVRDALGYVVDGAMNPLSYFIPIAATLGTKVEDTVNDRSLHLDLYQGFEGSTVDFYSGLRNAYLQRRQRLIEEGRIKE